MIPGGVIGLVRSNPALHERLKRVATAVGYDVTDWVRIVMYQRCFEFLMTLEPDRLDALEISAGPHWRKAVKFQSFTTTQYPGFDICQDTLPKKFDVIIADQVFEHLKWPARAARNVFAMLKQGGYFIIATPFLLRVHNSPIDCTRWTKEGLFYFLQEAGFPADMIKTDSWGNRTCLISNLKRWRKRGFFGSLVDEPDFPVMVWAFARKPPENRDSSARIGESTCSQRTVWHDPQIPGERSESMVQK